MSARDDQRATVPPPVGEDDAYSAATKVGEMPADLMEKLRAEGLLPEAADERVTAPPRSSIAADKRPTAALPPAKDSQPPPPLFSTPPPRASAAPAVTKPPATTAPPDSTETPIAFTKPPPSSLPPPMPKVTDADAEDDEPSRNRSEADALASAPKKPSALSLYVVGALVVVLLIVALMRLSR